MDGLTLIIGSKNYSSWSMRPWVLMRAAGVPFDEVLVLLDVPGYKDTIARWSPSRRVPALHHEGRVIWDSLAICEYLAELYPNQRLWPADRAARAHARSVVAELHSGFSALRTHCPMDLHRRRPGPGDGPGVAEDIARVFDLWEDALARSGGPYLFGTFGIADAFYAPVISRLFTYDKVLPEPLRRYAERVWETPAVREWATAAEAEAEAEAEADRSAATPADPAQGES